jgi:hypothetical protein
VTIDELLAQLQDERDQLDELITRIDWRFGQRSVIEARIHALDHVIVLLHGVAA